jgi:light-independent protochlorophyllide reductase subunit B
MLQCDVLLADVNHYRVNELQAADRTLQQSRRVLISKKRIARAIAQRSHGKTVRQHHWHDDPRVSQQPRSHRVAKLMGDLGIEVNLVLPDKASVHDLKKLTRAWFNLVPYREIGARTAQYLETRFGMPTVDITPMGIVDTARCIRKIQQVVQAQGAEVDLRRLH